MKTKPTLEDLKIRRDQLTARIQKAEARARATQKKAEDRIKILVGAMLLERVRDGKTHPDDLLADLRTFLERESERAAVLGEKGQGSETLLRLITPAANHPHACVQPKAAP